MQKKNSQNEQNNSTVKYASI